MDAREQRRGTLTAKQGRRWEATKASRGGVIIFLDLEEEQESA